MGLRYVQTKHVDSFLWDEECSRVRKVTSIESSYLTSLQRVCISNILLIISDTSLPIHKFGLKDHKNLLPVVAIPAPSGCVHIYVCAY